MSHIDFKISGMSCASCAARIQKGLLQKSGVKSAEVNIATDQASIEFDEGKINLAQIKIAIEDIGYKPILEEELKVFKKKIFDRDLINLILSAIFSIPLVLPMFTNLKLNALSELIIATPVQFIFGWRFYKSSYQSLKSFSFGMDTLVALGTSAAYFLSVYLMLFKESYHLYFESAVVVITFILLGKYLEARAKKQTQSAIEKLQKLKPLFASVVRGEKIKPVLIEDVKKEDIIFIKPGESIPLDGKIIEGSSSVDESMVTGESLAISKSKNDFVTGGTSNLDGAIRVKVTAIGNETVLSQMIKLVEKAQGKKTPIQKLVDEISSYFVPAVMIISLITLVGWLISGAAFEEAIIHAVSVLVIACPCALGLATPAAIMVGSGVAAKNGVLVRDTEAFELTHKLKFVALDKTGTLTKGQPVLTKLEKKSEKINLQILKTLQENSEHSLAKATLDNDEIKTISSTNVSNIKTLPGLGVRGELDDIIYYVGNYSLLKDKGPNLSEVFLEEVDSKKDEGLTLSYYFTEKEIFSVLCYKDEIKEDAYKAITELKKIGLIPIMITGDNEGAAKLVAKDLGIERYYANTLPEEKSNIIEKIKNDGMVAMVGDGINDAAALTLSDVGIAMGEGTDVAIHSAGITLMRSEPSLIPLAIKLSKATYFKIRQNLFWAFIYNIIGIPLAAFGYLSPMVAGLCMSLSSVSVLANALLLKRFKN